MPLGFDWKVVAAVGLPGVVIAIFAVLIKAFDLPLGNLTEIWLLVFLLALLLLFSLVIFYALKRWSPEASIRADLKRFTKRLKQQRKLSKKYRRDLDQIETNMVSEDKMMSKQFGTISARPSEYLVVTRRDGGMDDKRSGVGRGFFMVPWRSNRKFAVIPMTVKSIEYSTSVTTTDDVEVVIKGMLSYRIARPTLIFDKVNFNNREAGELKVMDMARKYCESVSQQIVGSLSYLDATSHGPKHISDITNKHITSEGSILGPDSPYGIAVDFFAVREVSLADQNLRSSILRKKSVELESAAALRALELQKEEAVARADIENNAIQQKHLIAEKEMSLERRAHTQILEMKKLDKELDEEVNPEKLREIFLTKTLPELGKAMSSQIGRVNIIENNAISNDGASQWGYNFLNNIFAIADHYGFRATSLLKADEEVKSAENHNAQKSEVVHAAKSAIPPG